MAVKWNDDAIKQRAQQAAKEGIDATMGLCTIYSKQHHNGWQNRTGTAEGSINIYQYARAEGDRVVGKWGSSDVAYFIWLELRYFTLRHSADVNYPRLPDLIRRAFARG